MGAIFLLLAGAAMTVGSCCPPSARTDNTLNAAEQVGSCELLRVVPFTTTLIVLFVDFACMAMQEPTFGLVLREPPYNLTDGQVGLILGASSYIIVLGALSSSPSVKRFGLIPVAVTAGALVSVGDLIYGPTPLLGLEPSMAFFCSGYALSTAGAGLLLPLGGLMLMRSLTDVGYQSTQVTESLAACMNAANQMSFLLGPVAGGAILDATSFPWLATSQAGFQVANRCLQLMFVVVPTVMLEQSMAAQTLPAPGTGPGDLAEKGSR